MRMPLAWPMTSRLFTARPRWTACSLPSGNPRLHPEQPGGHPGLQVEHAGFGGVEVEGGAHRSVRGELGSRASSGTPPRPPPARTGATGPRRPTEILGGDDPVLRGRLDRRDARALVQFALQPIELRDPAAGRVAAVDDPVLGHRDAPGGRTGDRLHGSRHDLRERLLQIADAAPTEKGSCRPAQGDDELLCLARVHALSHLQRSRRSRGGTLTQPCRPVPDAHVHRHPEGMAAITTASGRASAVPRDGAPNHEAAGCSTAARRAYSSPCTGRGGTRQPDPRQLTSFSPTTQHTIPRRRTALSALTGSSPVTIAYATVTAAPMPTHTA